MSAESRNKTMSSVFYRHTSSSRRRNVCVCVCVCVRVRVYYSLSSVIDSFSVLNLRGFFYIDFASDWENLWPCREQLHFNS